MPGHPSSMLVRPAGLDDMHPARDARRMADPWAFVDPLGAALHFLRMTGTFYVRSEMTAPWGLALPAMPGCMSFHVVTAGHCTLEVRGAPRRTLAAGDLALVPHGAGHILRSESRARAAPLFDLAHDMVSERYAVLRHGGGGAPTTLICGTVRFDHPAAHQLVTAMPPVLAIDAAHAARSPHADWLHSTLRLMAAEAAALRPGGETVITRLADILVIQAIRAWIERDGGERGWLAALADPQLGRALARVHAAPAAAWTVASLAQLAGMSRSAFAARFTERVGVPAMRYVARWRMHAAVARLRDGDATLAQLAGELGYQSEAAFSRAFKREIGHSPGVMRGVLGRSAGDPPIPAEESAAGLTRGFSYEPARSPRRQNAENG